MGQTIVSRISLPLTSPPVITEAPTVSMAPVTPAKGSARRQRAGLEELLALIASLAATEMPVPDLNILVVQPVAFDGEDWDLAASSLGLTTRIDVIATTETVPEHICKVASIMRPDAVVLDWRSPEAPTLFDALHTGSETDRIPVIILSADGEQAAPRMLCGVWEDPAPEGLDEVVHLLDAINSRTMLTRLAPQADPAELEDWFDWANKDQPPRNQ